MAHISADRVRETTTTTGTGALALAGIAPTGFRTFSSVCAVADTAYYAIQHQTSGEWEVGLGTYSAANTLTRTTIYASSNSGAAVNFSAGAKDVFVTLSASRTLALDPGASALALDKGGTGATTEAGARTNLGLGGLATKSTVATADIDNNAVTSAKMSNTGVSAGSYTAANITVDAAGRVTAAASGAAGGTINVQQFDSSGTWTKPAGYSANSRVLLQAWGAGGSGARQSTASNGGGGAGGGYIERWVTLSQLAATESITVGAGGASRTGTNQAGANGGNTTIGSLLTAYGGAGGGNGGTGGNGGGPLSAGTASDPGGPTIVDDAGNGTRHGGGGTGVAGAGRPGITHGGGGGSGSGSGTGGVGGGSVYGGAGGGGSGTTGTSAGGTSLFGGNGGAGGGATGTAGTQPAGAGGAGTSTSGAGAAGRAIITVFPA